MNAIDTNVLLYSVDSFQPLKEATASELVNRLAGSENTVLVWQVAVEFLNNLRKWQRAQRITSVHADDCLDEVLQLFPLILPSRAVLDRSLKLFARYSLSHWDSLLLAACLEAGVTTLYSEDLGHHAHYDGLTLINPFAE